MPQSPDDVGVIVTHRAIPIGVTPERLHIERRLVVLKDAIDRYQAHLDLYRGELPQNDARMFDSMARWAEEFSFLVARHGTLPSS